MHYYPKIGVATVLLSEKVSVGDMLHFKGKTTDFEDKCLSLQVNHTDIKKAESGYLVGIRVREAVKRGDELYKERTLTNTHKGRKDFDYRDFMADTNW